MPQHIRVQWPERVVACWMLAAAQLLASSAAVAANGYFLNGAGTNARALAGAGAALADDALRLATNPAAVSRLPGDTWQIGATFLKAEPEFDAGPFSVPEGGAPPGALPLKPGHFEHDPDTPNQVGGVFPIPHGAISWKLDNKSAFAIGVYGNGGLNNTYRDFDNPNCPPNTPQRGVLCFGDFASDIAQTFVAPTYARQLAPWLHVGGSLLLAWQTFEVRGADILAPQSSAPDNLTNNGHSNAFGLGAKLGFQADVSPTLRFGAAYQTKTQMSRFQDYSGLLAEQGSFDAPAQLQAGLAWDVTPRWTVAADFQRIFFGDIPALANRQDAPGQFGDDDGPGFGWRDVESYKFATVYRANPNWTFRLGYARNDSPLRQDHLLFNILAASTFEEHYTAGLTYRYSDHYSVDVALGVVPSEDISGPNFLYPDQQITVSNSAITFDLSWRRNFH